MNAEREKAILEKLIQQKQVWVKDLAKELYASEPSIRRDLVSLEKQHLIKRVHGGAILEENGISALKIPFMIRELEQSNEKIVMAKKAAALVKDGDVIFLDASSSAYNIIPFLVPKKNLTVITNGIKAMTKLSEYGFSVIGTGGNVVNSCMAMVGEDAKQTVLSYHADICFFSCRGVSDEGDLTDISIEENLVRRDMIRQSRQSYLLCASSKFGKCYYHTLCRHTDITGVISHAEIPNNWRS